MYVCVYTYIYIPDTHWKTLKDIKRTSGDLCFHDMDMTCSLKPSQHVLPGICNCNTSSLLHTFVRQLPGSSSVYPETKSQHASKQKKWWFNGGLMGFYGILWDFMVVLWDLMGFHRIYPLVICCIAMENHMFSNRKNASKWQFSIAMLDYQRVMHCTWKSFK